jgi:hypothetical protein
MIEEAATITGAAGFLPMPATDELELTAVLQALADPVRLRIVRELAAGGELACGRCRCPTRRGRTT